MSQKAQSLLTVRIKGGVARLDILDNMLYLSGPCRQVVAILEKDLSTVIFVPKCLHFSVFKFNHIVKEAFVKDCKHSRKAKYTEFICFENFQDQRYDVRRCCILETKFSKTNL